MPDLRALEYRDGCLLILDQRKLPGATVWIEARDYETVAEAIRTLAVRGAPAIGLAAAYGVVLAAEALDLGLSPSGRNDALTRAIAELESTRPTAVNLFWALTRMRRLIAEHADTAAEDLTEHLRVEADRMMLEDEAANRAMAELGASLIPDGARVLTHCNTGFLVSSRFGTALGAVRRAHECGKRVHVWVDETRPLLQGARLTAWELQQLEIPFTLITDNMAAHFMALGRVDMAMVGADRIAANGDTANKIGTYAVAVLCRAHDLPFYVVAPTSTVDLSLRHGSAITIEDRKSSEITTIGGVQIAPDGISVANPAFDVTPAELISGIVTEGGIARSPYVDDLTRHVEGSGPGLRG